MSRRQFLRASGFAAAAATLAPMLDLPGLPAIASPRQVLPPPLNVRVLQQAAQSTPFSALPSTTPLNTQLADISMGADGSIWAIDTGGVPFAFDQLSQRWELYVAAFDALTNSSYWNGQQIGKQEGSPLVVRGAQLFPANQPPSTFVALADAFQGLPDSFAFGLDGMAEIAGKLYLFRHGRYVVADTSKAGNPIVGAPVALTSLKGWPTTANWSSGTFDALASCADDPASTIVHFFSNGEYIVADLVQGAVTLQPLPYEQYARGTLRGVIEQQDFSAVLFTSDGHSGSQWPIWVYQGAIEWYGPNQSTGESTPSYPTFRTQITPTFKHAPSGRFGALWAATGGSTPNGAPAFYDGTTWQVPRSYPHTFDVIDVGDDGAVFALGDGVLLQLQSDGVTWSTLASAPSGAAQLSVGDAGHIWLRTASNTIYRYQNGSFATVPSFASATHLSANADGTVWATDNSSSAFRFISEGSAPASSIAVGSGTVVKVASTGFASALALTEDNQVHRYGAPYVWKTSDSYLPQFDYLGLTQSMVQAGHTMFVAAEDPDSPSAVRLVYALDTQTGARVWPNPAVLLLWNGVEGVPLYKAADINLAYDPALNLVYASGGTTLTALEAATGAKVWELDYTSQDPLGRDVWGPPTVVGGQLCVSDRWNGKLLLIDTAASLAQQQAQVRWSVDIPHPDNLPFVTAGAPVFDAGSQLIYLVSQVGDTVTATAFRPADGSQPWSREMLGADLGGYNSKFVHDALICKSTGGPSLLINGGLAIYAIVLADGSMSTSYVLPQLPSGPQTAISSGLSFYNNQLVFGDTTGKLYVLDTTTMQVVTTTTDSAPSGTTWYGVLGDPQLAHTDDPNDGLAVLFARGDANVWVFDPSNGALESIATDQTRIASLLYDRSHGLLYGCSSNGTTTESLGQLFALQPDQAIQDERDFIIESQLMQDYGSDDEAANGNGVARYQTHVSVVDGNKAAMASISVKLWAEDDSNATVVSIDGTSYTIGSTQPALFTTDGTGSFTITSTAGDLTTTSLRLWAAFMDASERITITPDVEFHQRLASATATGDTDPRQVDLVSAQSYDGKTLFASNEQSNAQQAASGISNTLGAMGIGSGGGGVQLRGLKDASLPKYTAYSTLPGMAYSPTNQAANRGITAVAPLGLSFTANGYATHTPGDAADLIDAMQGDTTTVLLGSFLSDLESAWNEIKSTAAKVEQAVVSIADEVYIGITYVVNGIKKVVKDIARDVDDALAAIGSFFVQLGKDLKQVVEALSLLLNLGEVLKTTNIISGQINATLDNLTPKLQQAKVDFDDFFADAENQINAAFCHLFDIMSLPQAVGCSTSLALPRAASGAALPSATSGTPLNTLNGAGSTPTSIYNTGQSGGSQAVQCGWSSHTMRTNLKGGSETTSLQLAQTSDTFLGLIEGFFKNLATDPKLKQAYSDVGTTFSASFQADSFVQFLKTAFEDLLELLKAIALTGVVIVQDLVDTLLGAINTVVQQMQDLGGVKIPILSALWKKHTGNDLTFVELLSFVLAFPATLIYRAATGHFPSESTATPASEGGVRLGQAGVSSAPSTEKMIADVMGLVGVGGYMLGGVLEAVLDTLYITEGPLAMRDYGLGWVAKLSGVCTLLQTIGTVGFSQVDPSDTWQDQTIARGVLTVALKMALFAGTRGDPEAAEITGPASSIVGSLFAAWGIVINGLKYATSSSKNPLILSQAIMALVPPLVNPIKLTGDAAAVYPLIAPAADVTFACIAGGLLATEAIESMMGVGVPEPEQVQLLYFPLVSR